MLIGLASLKPQTGKSTIAQFLKKKYGFIHTEMSDAISLLADKYFGYNSDEKSDSKQRMILQELGIMGKRIDPTMWLYHAIGLARRKKWGLAVDTLISPSFLFYYHLNPIKEEIHEKGIDSFMEGAHVVVGGIRSPGEADEILKIGGHVYLISRDEELNLKNQHKVETELSGYKYFTDIIDNNGTIEELYALFEKILNLEG